MACKVTNLQQKAVLIDQLINQIKSRIACIKSSSGSSGSNCQEETLRRENATLKQKIEVLKDRLCSAESKNGIKQLSLPSKGKPLLNQTNYNSTTTQPAKPAEPSAVNKDGKENQRPHSKSDKKETNNKDAAPKKEKAPSKAAPSKSAAAEVIDVSRLDMRIGKIVQVDRHPDADSLYLEKVDIGGGNVITVVSGLVKHVPLEQMQNRVAIFMCNLKPAKMRGILSEGMIMCASSPDHVEILVPPPDSQPGDRVSVREYPGEPDAQLNPKKKIWEQVKPDLRVDANGFACYKGAQWNVADKGPVKSSSLVDVQIS